MAANPLKYAIYQKMIGSTFGGLIGNRLYERSAPYGTPFPYCVFFVVSSAFEKTFTEDFKNVIVQFSIFSESTDETEIDGIYDALSALYDEARLTLSSGTLLRMMESNLTQMDEEVTTQSGMAIIKHYAVDFEILIEV